jgi:hypothetical protein
VECADDVEACVDVYERAGDADDMRDRGGEFVTLKIVSS